MADKTAKPKMEDVLVEVLEGEQLKHAQDFVAFLRTNKMSPRWASANSWAVSYKGKRVCFIRVSGTAHYHKLDNGSWHINHVSYGPIGKLLYTDEHEQYISDEKLKEMVWDNVKYCSRCANCKPGNAVEILGKRFENVCHSWIVMKNPDEDTLNCAKRIVLIRREAIAKSHNKS